ncbi:MAG: transcriptional repressor [Opitutales bacterium]|nr:transcriptional repressor [Opitutales bacterium]
MIELDPIAKEKLERALARKGLRSTRQREQVFAVVYGSDDHPAADVVYQRVKNSVPGISLATVYNCLETLSDCELIRQVNFEREPSRFCLNKEHSLHHAHFHCRDSGKVIDVDLPNDFIENLSQFLPGGYRIDKIDLTLSGTSAENQRKFITNG